MSRRGWGLAGATGLLCLLAVGASLAVSPTQPYGTLIRFHGWSPDSKLIAYTRIRSDHPRPGKAAPAPKTRSEHRRVTKKGTLGTRGPGFGKDLVAYAARKHYVSEPRVGVPVDDRLWRIPAPEGDYMLDLQVDERMWWELSWEGQILARKAFDTLYVGAEVTLFPSPDRTAAVLVMQLDTGWELHGAVFPVSLPASLTARWQAMTVPVPKDAKHIAPPPESE